MILMTENLGLAPVATTRYSRAKNKLSPKQHPFLIQHNV
jgi:hypothetical protein